MLDPFTDTCIDTGSADDPNEISFAKGELLDILDKQGKWWQAKKSDGTVGSEFPFVAETPDSAEHHVRSRSFKLPPASLRSSFPPTSYLYVCSIPFIMSYLLSL